MVDTTITISSGRRYDLTAEEQEWVSASSDGVAALLCIRYALVYARRQPEWLLEVCHPDVEYTSQLIDNHHIGLDEVRRVFEERMTEPDWYPESGTLPFFELATMPDSRPCIVLVQRKNQFDSGLGRLFFWMTFTCDVAGRVIGMHSGFLPSPLELDYSGLYPGIPEDLLAREKAHEPAVLPAGAPLRFMLLHEKDDTGWYESAVVAKEALRFFNMANLELIPIVMDHSKIEDARMLFRKGVLALPHLHIAYDDRNGGRIDVLSLDGPFDRERLMQELYRCFSGPGDTNIEPGIVKGLLEDPAPGMGETGLICWHYYCDPERMEEILEAFCGDNALAAQRAAYVLDRLSLIKKDVIQPHATLLLGIPHDDPNTARLRHVARMLPRLTLDSSERLQAEKLLLNLAWQQHDTALQVFALASLRHFAKMNFQLREFAGQFVFDLMQRTRNGRVIREAERTLDTIEYFEEKVHQQWDRLQAHA